MNSDAQQRILRSASDEFIEQIIESHSHFSRRKITESPIEELFLLGFIAATFTERGAFINAENDWHIEYAEEYLGEMGLCLRTQYKADKYRVDFVLNAARVTGYISREPQLLQSCIAIECDGAAYHHGNPAAAAKDKARDRVLAEHFDAILRFTGAEINANAFTCVRQAISVAETKLRVV